MNIYNPNSPNNPNQIYLNLWNEAKSRDYSKFFNQLETDFGVKITEELKKFTNQLALKTQITIKKSKPLYLHGYLLYCALTNYLNEKNQETNYLNEENQEINILETGTARGFSAIMMAKAIDDYLKTKNNNSQDNFKQEIKIHTIDIVPYDKLQHWKCYTEPICTLLDLISDYDYLKKYINFITGDTKEKIDELINKEKKTINFSFLDAHHNYEYLKMELDKVRDNSPSHASLSVSKKENHNQIPKQIIICDDYTIYNKNLIVKNPKTNRLQQKLHYQYPGIIQAIEEFKQENPNYTSKIYWGEDGVKRRGYVVLSQ